MISHIAKHGSSIELLRYCAVISVISVISHDSIYSLQNMRCWINQILCRFDFVQLHLHWGSSSDKGSEHTVWTPFHLFNWDMCLKKADWRGKVWWPKRQILLPFDQKVHSHKICPETWVMGSSFQSICQMLITFELGGQNCAFGMQASAMLIQPFDSQHLHSWTLHWTVSKLN